jgi:SNF2 family DNA or RNA helicase
LEFGKKIDAAYLSAVLKNLEKKGLLHLNRLNPIIQHTLVREVLKNTKKRQLWLGAWGLLKESRQVLFSSGDEDEIRVTVLKIYCLEKNQTDEANKVIHNPYFFDALKWIFSRHVHDPEWLNQLPPLIQTHILSYFFQRMFQYTEVVPDMNALMTALKVQEGRSGWEGLTGIFLAHAVCSADLKLIPESCCKNMPNDENQLLYLASIAFLKGDFIKAAALFNDDIKLFKKQAGIRKYFPPGIEGIFYILSLLQTQNPSFYPLIQEGITLVLDKTQTPYEPAFDALASLIKFLNTRVHDPDSIMHSIMVREKNPINLAVMQLCRYWFNPQVKNAVSERHHEVFLFACKHMTGIARILAEVWSKTASEPAPYLQYLKESKDCYTISFLEIVPFKEVWECSLESIERLFPFKENENQPKDASATQERRLLWQVDLSQCRMTGVVEQKISAKGVWTKGRPVSLEKLKKGGPDFPYLSEQDRKIVQTIHSQPYGYYGKEEWKFDQMMAFSALVGHTNVIDVDSELPVEFVKGTVELLVQEKDNHYSLSLSGVHDSTGVLLKKETDTRVQVIDFTAEHVKLYQAIGRQNLLVIPKTEKKRLKTILKSVEMRIPVLSELDDESVRKAGDTALNIQLVPLDSGVKINLFVRPFGSEGPCFRPGHGFPTPQAVIKGKSQRVLRNLQEERQQADQLINIVRSLSTSDCGMDEWIFDNPYDALEVISEIHAYPHPIKMVWPQGQKWHVSAPTNAKSLKLKIAGDHNWFSLEGGLEVNEGQIIELKQLLALIDSSDQRFIPIGDKQFLALTDHFKRQLRELKAITENSNDKVWMHPLASSALNELLNEAGECKADEKWKELKDRIQNSQAHQPKVPSTLQVELRPYQVEGFQWLSRLAHWGVGGCLADDMGLGKTLQALALVLEHAPQGPTLVVAPTSVCYNWINEAKRFAPTLDVLLHAHNRKVETVKDLGPQQLLVTSYGLLYQESELLSSVKWQTVILDEAQSIKNVNTKRSQAAQQLQGKVKMILTGTPLENRLSDLWNLFRFINPGLLGSYESFNKRFADPIEQRKDIAARHALKKLIQPFILRRLKTQVLAELPPRIEKTIIIPQEKEELAFYEALRRNAIEKLTSMSAQEKKRMHILAEIMRLRRACCHSGLVSPEIDIPSSKLTMLLELLEELKENNHRALVFSQFVGFLEKTRALLDEKKISYQYLDGSTPIEERLKRVNAFQAGEGDLFLISLKAGGTGLNLTAADYVIHLDPWWNPAVEDQASDRAHRMGQTRPVTIYRLIMEGTIEEKMVRLHQDKRGLANDLLEGTDTSSKMSEEELLALLGV